MRSEPRTIASHLARGDLVQAPIMIAGGDHLHLVGESIEPVAKVVEFLVGAAITEVATMDQHVSRRDAELAVLAMCV